MPSTSQMVVAAGGIAILTRRWPSRGEPWAHVLLVHGLGEHSGRYEHVGDYFADAGLAVHAYDHRGNGASGGPRGDLERWSTFHEDLADRHRVVAAEAGGLPVVLYGHSMGGLVVTGYCLDGYPRASRVVLSSPGLDSTMAPWKRWLAPALARVAPTLSLPNGIEGQTLSRDPRVGEAMERDPLCVTHSTVRFGAAAFGEQARLRPLASRGFGVPTLVIHGEDDGLVPVEASAVFSRAPATTRRTYAGLRHELHNEPEGPAVLADVVAWLRAG